MKSFCKWLVNSLHLFNETAISIAAALVFSKLGTKKNFLKVIHSPNDAIYILGNGKSLNSFLSENKSNMPEHIMVVNYFATAPQFRTIKPRHYIMIDNNLCIKADEGNEKAQSELVEALLEIDWNINLYIPTDSNSDLLKKLSANPHINLILFNRTPVDGIKNITYCMYNLRMGMPRPQNVTNAAVFCAVAAGFKTVYLYGVEYSWTKSFDVDPETHRVFLNDGHFYKNEYIRYLPKGEYMRWLNDIAWALRSHYTLRGYADYCGVRVINKTKQSFVEAYEYED